MLGIRVVTEKVDSNTGTVTKWYPDSGAINDLKELFNYVSSAFKAIAREELLVSQTKHGFPKQGYRTIVDGRYDVGNNLDGAIKEITFVGKAAVGTVLEEMMRSVVTLSPLDTGQYVRNHALFVNSYLVGQTPQEVAAWLGTDPDIKAGDAIRLVNLVPYAGKLEREGFRATKTLGAQPLKPEERRRMKKYGKKGAKIEIRQPNGAYYLTVRKLLLKYKFNSIIKFEWVNGGKIPGLNNMTFRNQRGYIQGSGGAALGSKTKHKTKTKPYAYPSILIYVKEGGITL